jgi:hypothetical protein
MGPWAMGWDRGWETLTNGTFDPKTVDTPAIKAYIVLVTGTMYPTDSTYTCGKYGWCALEYSFICPRFTHYVQKERPASFE